MTWFLPCADFNQAKLILFYAKKLRPIQPFINKMALVPDLQGIKAFERGKLTNLFLLIPISYYGHQIFGGLMI